MTTPGKVLDSYAVMTYLEDEAGSEQVADLLRRAVRDEITLTISVVNLGEVYYSIARTNSLEIADQMLMEFTTLPVKVVDVDWELARQAAVFKAGAAIAYGDCFCAALAYRMNSPVVTGDREFKRLADTVEIEWIDNPTKKETQ